MSYLVCDPVHHRGRRRRLLSPFDSLIWDRARTKRLFGFDFRIEVYVPEAARRHGYYVLPLLVGDALVGRLDLKADRKASTLRVLGSFIEDGQDPNIISLAAVGELDAMRSWLGLATRSVASRGSLGPRPTALNPCVTQACVDPPTVYEPGP